MRTVFLFIMYVSAEFVEFVAAFYRFVSFAKN